jgi:hypothetical protein
MMTSWDTTKTICHAVILFYTTLLISGIQTDCANSTNTDGNGDVECLPPIVAKHFRGDPLVQPLNYAPINCSSAAEQEELMGANGSATATVKTCLLDICIFGEK